MDTARATIVVEVDQPDEAAAIDAWFARWQSRLTHCSDNLGCGCCVDIWEVQGPRQAIDELPPAMRAEPGNRNGRSSARALTVAGLTLCDVAAAQALPERLGACP